MFNLHISQNGFLHSHNFRRGLVALFWITGLLLGYYFSLHIPPETASSICTITSAPVSFAGLFFSQIIPFVLTAVFVWFRISVLILPVVFLKAVSFSFSSSALALSFWDAGWLLYRFYTFADSWSVIILLWLWYSCADREVSNFNSRLLLSVITTSCGCCFDYFIVSPFLLALFKH